MYRMTDTEWNFARLIWESEPVASGELVRLCENRFAWKKSTTYTFLKKLCEQGIFQNESAQVHSLISEDAYLQEQGEQFVAKTFDGSLPKMIAAFMRSKSLSREEVAEIEQMIDAYKEETV
ncbi:MAG: BlaI/MecI/CopY family transcriptional regulator [Lachnospiraceae bacterium]|nr:BlaI/MecI/CopY family transcriptional regulator [Lachnospiraceae bacterium]